VKTDVDEGQDRCHKDTWKMRKGGRSWGEVSRKKNKKSGQPKRGVVEGTKRGEDTPDETQERRRKKGEIIKLESRKQEKDERKVKNVLSKEMRTGRDNSKKEDWTVEKCKGNLMKERGAA